MATLIDSSFFDKFGKITYSAYNINSNIVHDSAYTNNKFQLFKQISKDILLGENNFNIVLFHNLVFHVTNENPSRVDNIIIECFNEETLNIKQNIQNKIDNNNFTISYFIELYKKYYTNGKKFSEYVNYFDSKVETNGLKKYSHVNLIRNYVFYKNVVSCFYKSYNKEQELCLYELFSELIEQDTIPVEEIIQLFKMYAFYQKLSYTVDKNDRDLIFNPDINKMFLITMGSNQGFVKKISCYLHEKILSCKENKREQDNVCDLITMISNYFLEKDMFNMYYEKFLEIRLLNNKTDIDIEKKFINKFKRPVDNKIIQNILYKLEDIQNSGLDKIICDKTKISINSEKFKGKIHNFDHKKMYVNVFRNYAWSYNRDNEIEKMNIPFEVSPYVSVYDIFYKKKYPNRELVWDFNNGTSVIKLTLGGRDYKLHVTIPQLFLLLQFNQEKEITAKDLAANLGISLSKLASLLNVMLKTRIISRESNKAPNDTSCKMFLNENFKYSEENISLINVSINASQQKNTDKEIEDKFSIGRINICKAHVVRTMKVNKKLTYKDIFNNVKITLPFHLENSMLNDVIKSCIEEDYIQKDNDDYKYLEEVDE